MRFIHFRILLGGLAVLLAIQACSMVSPVTSIVKHLSETATQNTPSSPEPVPLVPATAAETVPSLRIASSPSIHSLNMLDANNGWALAETGVVRTLDGGATWFDVTPASLNGAPANSFFLDTTNGWVTTLGADPTSGTLYHTADGGSTWTSGAVPFGGGSLHFVDALNGWELIGLNAGMSHEAVSVYRTSDGGATWSKVFTDDPGAPGTSDSLPLVGDKNGITALDNNHAWVTGAQPSDNFIYIYATQVGGTSWAHQDVSLPAGNNGAMTNPGLPVFFDASEAVLPVSIVANTNSTDFYVSHDGGQTWSATTPLAQGGFLAVASATDFFVWDGSAPLNVSHDAGATWSTITPNINIKEDMNYLQFVNNTTCWALTSDANGHCMVYKTTDRGASWNVLVP
jgi:photosystem II stability/assembly factor-like uncharacterized protein